MARSFNSYHITYMYNFKYVIHWCYILSMLNIPTQSAPEVGSAACLKNRVTSCRLCAPRAVIWLSLARDNGGRFRTTSDAVHRTSLHKTGLPVYNKKIMLLLSLTYDMMNIQFHTHIFKNTSCMPQHEKLLF